MAEEQGTPEPLRAPDIKRSLRFTLVQLIGVPLILCIPALAILGVFGHEVASVQSVANDFQMFVTAPTKLRYKMLDSFDIIIRNTSEAPLNIKISLDNSYFSNFSTVSFSPRPSEITSKKYTFLFSQIPARQTRRLSATMQAENYGKHSGAVVANSESGTAAYVRLSTIVFP